MEKKLQKIYLRYYNFNDSASFMESSLLNLVNYVSEGIYKVKCKYGHNDKKCEICRIKYKYCDCFYEYTNFKDRTQIVYKWLYYNKNYQQFDEKLKDRLFSTCKFSNNNKFILMLQKGVYPYEYMDD